MKFASTVTAFFCLGLIAACGKNGEMLPHSSGGLQFPPHGKLDGKQESESVALIKSFSLVDSSASEAQQPNGKNKSERSAIGKIVAALCQMNSKGSRTGNNYYEHRTLSGAPNQSCPLDFEEEVRLSGLGNPNSFQASGSIQHSFTVQGKDLLNLTEVRSFSAVGSARVSGTRVRPGYRKNSADYMQSGQLQTVGGQFETKIWFQISIIGPENDDGSNSSAEVLMATGIKMPFGWSILKLTLVHPEGGRDTLTCQLNDRTMESIAPCLALLGKENAESPTSIATAMKQLMTHAQ